MQTESMEGGHEALAVDSAISRLTDAGFVVMRGFLPDGAIADLGRAARAQLSALAAPVEFEADLRYPGAPTSREAPGGKTARRLLGAYDRDPLFARVATAPRVRTLMEAYFGEEVALSRVHHNCLMTKHPSYGSETGWHRDIRYWSFEQQRLVSVWFALGNECAENGALRFIPGSQRMILDADRFDAAGFFRDDVAANAALIRGSVCPTLQAGDAVIFHCGTLHSAGKNAGADVKLSLVYTYHALSNRPLAGTRSASLAEVVLNRTQPEKRRKAAVIR